MDEGYNRLSEIATVMKGAVQKGAVPTPEKLTVREFLGWYDYARRGPVIVSRIRNDLERLELRTNPDIEVVWIDSTISIELQPDVHDDMPLAARVHQTLLMPHLQVSLLTLRSELEASKRPIKGQ